MRRSADVIIVGDSKDDGGASATSLNTTRPWNARHISSSAPATGSLMLRASDVSDTRAPRQVRVFEVPVTRGDKELRLDDFVVTDTMGFAAGRSYEFVFEAPGEEGVPGGEAKKAGKADVYAKGVITLR